MLEIGTFCMRTGVASSTPKVSFYWTRPLIDKLQYCALEVGAGLHGEESSAAVKMLSIKDLQPMEE